MIFPINKKKTKRTLSQRLEDVAQYAHHLVGNDETPDLEAGIITPSVSHSEDPPFQEPESPPVSELSEFTPLLTENNAELVIYAPQGRIGLLATFKNWLYGYFQPNEPQAPAAWWISLFVFFVVVTSIVVIASLHTQNTWLLSVGCQLEKLFFGSDRLEICRA